MTFLFPSKSWFISLSVVVVMIVSGTGLIAAAAASDSYDCTYTQGYWKNHAEAWPVTELTLGGITYTQEELLDILNTPVRGDASYNLMHQLIAAQLNIAQGADDATLAEIITNADDWLYDNPLGSDPSGADRAAGIQYAGAFDSYNNGRTGPGHCDDDNQAPATTEATAEPADEGTPYPTDEPTDESTDEPTGEPTGTPTPYPTPMGGGPTLIFINNIRITQICQGAYVAQRTLVNYGNVPVTNAALVWEVIEGAEFVDTVALDSDSLEAAYEDAQVASIGSTAPTSVNTSLSITNNTVATPTNYANFSQISVEQKVKLDLKVKVKDSWWHQPDGTKVKVKLSIKNKIEISNYYDTDHDDGDQDHDYGNDQGDDDDNDNHYDDDYHHFYPSGPSQIITIVKQGAQWVTLNGAAHPYGNQTLLVDGRIVVLNNCTGLPPRLVPGAKVQIIGWLLPDGTFMAINITIINVNIITVNFDSGVPVAPPSSGGDDDDDDGGGGSGGSGGRGGDHDRGHGNDADGHDEDNPGKSHR